MSVKERRVKSSLDLARLAWQGLVRLHLARWCKAGQGRAGEVMFGGIGQGTFCCGAVWFGRAGVVCLGAVRLGQVRRGKA